MSQSQTQPMQHADSVDSQDHADKDKKKHKSRRPANTAFRQQRLKAWQPILTPKTVLPLFFAVGLIFAPIGGLLLYASSLVEEISIDYSRCSQDAGKYPNWKDIPSGNVKKYFKKQLEVPTTPQWSYRTESVTYPDSKTTVPDTIICSLRFSIENDLTPPVLLYYRLTQFYQNHRRYVKSYDPGQMKGQAKDGKAIQGGGCNPLTTDKNGKPYYPCGLIANSLFNDTFTNITLTNSQGTSASNTTYPMTSQGIAWSTDGALYGETSYKAEDVVPPVNWRRKWPAYNSSIPLPNLHTDEAFHVWMRTAGLPDFSKLALRNDNRTMKAGQYQIDIWDEFNVTSFGGTKAVVISTRTVIGGKNPFLGIAYVVVGGLCILLGAIFTATHIIKPRKLGDHTYLSWNNEQPSTAAATGRSIRPGGGNDS